MKTFALLLLTSLLLIPILGHALTINGTVPGGTGSMTATACPTGAAILAACKTATTCQRKAIDFFCIGTANCFVAPAPPASPCASASPAPLGSTKAGIWIPPNTHYTYRADQNINPNDPAICGEWDMSCDASGNFMGYSGVP